MNISLDDLLNDLGSQPDETMTKSASTKEPVIPNITKQAGVDYQAQAFAEGEQVARALLEKMASAKPVDIQTQSTQDQNMKSLLQKIAEATDGIALDQVSLGPNITQENTAAQVASDDAKVQPTPAQEGTAQDILTAIVQKMQAKGAGPENIADDEQLPVPGAGVTANLAGGVDENIEKAAAVSYLTENGLGFDEAVELVKAAELSMEKEAALDALVEAGYDFDDAVTLVKAAEESMFEAGKRKAVEGYNKAKGMAVEGYNKAKGMAAEGAAVAKGAKGRLVSDAKKLAKDVPGLITGKHPSVVGDASLARKWSAGNLAHNRIVQGLAAAGAIGGLAVGAKKAFSGQEKKAAFDELVGAGYDYETAVALIDQACD